MSAAESAWLVERCVRGPVAETLEILSRWRERLASEEVKMPLNVACSDVLRGVLTRRGDRVGVAGHARFHHHDFEVHNAAVVLPQLALLRAALEQVYAELAALTPDCEARAMLDCMQSVQSALVLARRQLASPERALRFPERFFALGPHAPTGYCGEMFACEEHNLVFNLHAYQDRGRTYVAGDSVSVKGADPQLSELWEAVDARLAPALQQVAQKLRALLSVPEK